MLDWNPENQPILNSVKQKSLKITFPTDAVMLLAQIHFSFLSLILCLLWNTDWSFPPDELSAAAAGSLCLGVQVDCNYSEYLYKYIFDDFWLQKVEF